MKIFWLIGLSLNAIILPLAAQFSVNPMLINFFPSGAQYQDVRIFNQGAKTLYLNITALKIQNPGLPTQKEIAFSHQNPYDFGLVVSPKAMVLEAHQARLLRVMILHPDMKHETVYFVNIIPAQGEMEFIDSGKHMPHVQLGMQIIMGFQLKVFVRPKLALPALSIQQKGKDVYLKNTGNTNILIQEVRYCKTAKEAYEDCSLLPQVKRLYAGNDWHFQLPKALPVKILQQYINQYSVHSAS